MNENQLSPRLKKIYELLIPQKDVWDICCDHGYVGQVALRSGNFLGVHFVDKGIHIIEKLQKDLKNNNHAYFYPHEAQLLRNPLNGNLIISGVGAQLILSIVRHLWGNSILHVDRMILAPNKDEKKLTDDFAETPHLLDFYKETDIIEANENGRTRCIYVFDRRK